MVILKKVSRWYEFLAGPISFTPTWIAYCRILEGENVG
jgi:hypothetical protein